MPARSPGLSGIAVTMMVGGTVLAVSAIKNASIPDTVRALIRGNAPKGSTTGSFSAALEETASTLTAVSEGSAVAGAVGAAAGAAVGPTGARVAADAGKYIGIPYVFGGASPSGFDCSGLVNYVLGHDLGLPIPGSPSGKFSGHGPGSLAYYQWGEARTIGTSASSASAGDLVCWPGHIGIAVGNGQMIAAPTPGEKVKQQAIYGGCLIRRPNSYGG